ncbi:MAG: hypothetical protein ACOY3I_02310 [Verrucomicrobiota bacterium]
MPGDPYFILMYVLIAIFIYLISVGTIEVRVGDYLLNPAVQDEEIVY